MDAQLQILEKLLERLSSDNRVVIADAGSYTREKGFFLYVGVEGTATYVDWNGNTGTDNFVVGYHPTKLKSISLGTATSVRACF